MIKLNYKIYVETVEDPALSSLLNTTGIHQSIRNYSSVDGIRLVVEGTDLISNAFKRHKTEKTDILKKDGYIYKQEKTEYNLHQKVDYFDILDLSETTYKEFLQKFGKYIICKVNDKLPKGISMYDEIRVVEITEDTVTKIGKDLYGVELHLGRVYIDTLLDPENLYVLLFRDANKIVKVDNNFDISNERLLGLQSGFYQILPKYYLSTTETFVSKTSGVLSLKTDSLVEIVSDVCLNIDGCTTNSFILQPGIEVPFTYKQDYTPLVDIKEFWTNKEYIVFEVKGNNLEPLYHLTKDGEEPTEEYKTLLKSHPEFLRKYVVLANTATVLQISEDTNRDNLPEELKTSERVYLIDNTYFKQVLKDYPNLTKIKI